MIKQIGLLILIFLFTNSAQLYCKTYTSPDSAQIEQRLQLYRNNYLSQDSFKQAQILINDVRNYSQKIGYLQGVMQSEYLLGIILVVKNYDVVAAVDHFFQCIKLSEKLGNNEYKSKSYNYLGIIYHSRYKYVEAIDYFNKSIGIKWNESESYKGIPYYLIGLSHYELKNYDFALLYLDTAMQIANKLRQEDRIHECEHGIARVFLAKGNNKDAYDNIQKTIRYYNPQNNRIAQGVSYFLLARVYMNYQKIDSAYVYARMAYDRFQNSAPVLNIVENDKLLSEIYYRKKDYRNAFRYMNEMQTIKDSLYKNDISTQIGLAQAHYNFDKERKQLNMTILQQEKDKKRAIMVSTVFGALLIMIAGLLYFVRKERKKSEELLLNILPRQTAIELKQFGKAIARKHESTTVMFCDIKQFSVIAETLNPEVLVEMLDVYFRQFDVIISEYKLEKIKIIGDAYMCVGGLHDPNINHAVNAIRAALAIRDFVNSIKSKMIEKYGQAFEFRSGLHTGSLVSGVVGFHKYSYDVWGDTVNIAARMESSGETGKINISDVTYQHVKDIFYCESRGQIEVKNNRFLEMYFVEDK